MERVGKKVSSLPRHIYRHVHGWATRETAHVVWSSRRPKLWTTVFLNTWIFVWDSGRFFLLVKPHRAGAFNLMGCPVHPQQVYWGVFPPKLSDLWVCTKQRGLLPCCLAAVIDRCLIRHNYRIKASSKNVGLECWSFKITFTVTYDTIDA